MTPLRHLLVFDPHVGGHHGQYVRQVMRYWTSSRVPGLLDVVVSASLVARSRDLVGLAGTGADQARLITLPIPPGPGEGSIVGRIRSDLAHGRALASEIRARRPDHVLLLSFDQLQVPLALGLRFPDPLRISGIYFRPSFHYGRLGVGRETVAGRFRNGRKRVLLGAALRNPHFDTLFCLDPLAIPELKALYPSARIVRLPDGIERSGAVAPPEQVRRCLGVEGRRQLLLLFGALARRKGVFQLLDALQHLPEEVGRNACVALIGETEPALRESLARRVSEVHGVRQIQTILRDTFVPEDRVAGLLEAADLVLLPYVRHIGSSGVLVRAAAAGVPVVGPDYGLLGALIREHGLGLTVNTDDPRSLAEGIATCLRRPPDARLDRARAARFAEENSAERFCEVLFEQLTRSRDP